MWSGKRQQRGAELREMMLLVLQAGELETKERSTFSVVLFDTSKPMTTSTVACLHSCSPK